MVKNSSEIINWEAKEYVVQEKNTNWYVGLVVVSLLLILVLAMTCTAALADRKVSFPGTRLSVTLPDGFSDISMSQQDINDDMICCFGSGDMYVSVWEWANDNGSALNDYMNDLQQPSVHSTGNKPINGHDVITFSGSDASGSFVGCVYVGSFIL